MKKEFSNMYGALDKFVEEEMPDIDAIGRSAVVNSLWNFMIDSIAKFSAGQKEHGGNLADRDLDKEIRGEMIDLFWYTEARKWSKNK